MMPIPSPTETASAPAVQTTAPAAHDSVQPSETSNLLLRNDTILGTCEAIGRDFGFNPNFLRIPLAGAVLISPIAAFGIYFALGFAVLLSRLIAPAPRQIAAPQAAVEAQPRGADNQTNEERLAA
jgi:phage shock protein C